MSFDSLTHLDFPSVDTQRAAMVDAARQAGIEGWVIAGTTPTHWSRVIQVAKETGGTPILGVHPWWASELTLSDLEQHLSALADRRDYYGLGEIGLDYARGRDTEDRLHQKQVFRTQLAFARDQNLPIAIHCVRAHSDLLHILKTEGLPQAGGVLHGWSGGPQFVPPALALGLMISFGTSVLNPKRKKVHQSIPLVPSSQLCIETDCPDQPIEQGDIGHLTDLKRVAITLSQLRGEDVTTLWRQCGGNARKLWHPTSG